MFLILKTAFFGLLLTTLVRGRLSCQLAAGPERSWSIITGCNVCLFSRALTALESRGGVESQGLPAAIPSLGAASSTQSQCKPDLVPPSATGNCRTQAPSRGAQLFCTWAKEPQAAGSKAGGRRGGGRAGNAAGSAREKFPVSCSFFSLEESILPTFEPVRARPAALRSHRLCSDIQQQTSK